jgi:hypothetical protein
MTEFAVFSPDFFVHMKKVQVPVPIPESRRKRGIREPKEIGTMTGKTQIILIIGIALK